MATRFVSAVDGNNADNGTTWALAKQTVAGALAISSAGDVIVVDNAGTFTATAAITWTPPAGAVAIISVTRSGAADFTPAAGAIEQVGAANSIFHIANAAKSSVYVYGMTIKGGTNNSTNCYIGIAASAAQISRTVLHTCTFDLPSVAGVYIQLGSGGAAPSQEIQIINPTFLCTGSHVWGYLNLNNAKVEIINPTFSFTGASKPHGVIFFSSVNTNQAGTIVMRDGDVSGYSVAAGAIASVGNLSNASVLLENLKINAATAIYDETWPGGRGSITVRNCDSGDTTYVFQYLNAYGTLTADTAVYVTSGGAEFDGAGASWKIVTTADCSESFPFVTPVLFAWDSTLTAQTAAIEIIRDNATLLTDHNIWSDFDYAASASFPNYAYAHNRNAEPFTGTPANQPTSTVAWTGTGGFGTATKQKLEHAFTAVAAGLVQARVSVGVASTTIYIDPYIGGVT